MRIRYDQDVDVPAIIFKQDIPVEESDALAHAVRRAIATRNLDTLVEVIRESWRENTIIHPSTTNPEIEDLLHNLAPHYQAVKLLGAGGGGYALFISPSADAAATLRQALDSHVAATANPRARRVELSLNKRGLQVTVS